MSRKDKNKNARVTQSKKTYNRKKLKGNSHDWKQL